LIILAKKSLKQRQAEQVFVGFFFGATTGTIIQDMYK